MDLLTPEALGRHTYVIGGTGVGKSRWLEYVIIKLLSLMKQLLSLGGLGVIDPHGELYNNLVARIAATKDRGLWERIILVDPQDPHWTVGINPLQLLDGELVERNAQFLAGVVARIWRVDELVTARMMRMMFHSFWLLANLGLTLAELPLLLGNKQLRRSLVEKEPALSGPRQYFTQEFPRDDRTIVEWTQSTLNKAGQLSTDPEIRLLLGQPQSTFSFRQLLDEGYILLVNLSKGSLLAENAHILGGFIMAQLQQTALARAQRPNVRHKYWTLFADEFHNYTTETIQEILVETRKYKMPLVFANQVFGYLREMPELQAAVLNSVGNLICFRMGDKDAQIFSREVFQPSFEQVKDIRVRYQDVPFLFGEVKQRFDDNVYRTVEETWEYEIRKLTGIADREFWWKRRGPNPARLFRTRDMPDVTITPRLRDLIVEFKETSNRRWARRKEDVAREIRERQGALLTGELFSRTAPTVTVETPQKTFLSKLKVTPAYEEVREGDLAWLLEDETPWYWDTVE